jgi:hypothetical protein
LFDLLHGRQRAPVGNALSSSGTSQLGMFDIQATTKSKYYDHIVLLHLESRRCRYRSIIFACFYLYITVVSFIDYSDRKMTEHFRPELFDDRVIDQTNKMYQSSREICLRKSGVRYA